MKMKKVLGFIALAVAAIALPIKAEAASLGLSFVKGDTVGGYFDVTIKGVQDGGNVLSTPLTTTMTMTNVEYVEGSITGTSNWTATVTGNTITLTPTTPVSDSEFTVATLRFKETGGKPCDVVFECNGKKTVIENKETVNPTTGSSLPYVVIVGGITVAAGVYYFTRRNTKLYKI